MNPSWKRPHPTQPFSPRQTQLCYVIPDISFLMTATGETQQFLKASYSRVSQSLHCRFSLWSDLKFSCSRKPLISCTTQHDTEHTRCPFSTQLLQHQRPTTSLPIFLSFRLNSSISSDPSPQVISLRYQITLLWTPSNDTDVALGEWCPNLGKSAPAMEKGSSQTYQAPHSHKLTWCSPFL